MSQSEVDAPDGIDASATDVDWGAIHARALTPPVISAEDAEAWFEMLEAPPRDMPGLRKFTADTEAIRAIKHA